MDKQIFMLLGLVITLLLIYLYLESFNPKNRSYNSLINSPGYQEVPGIEKALENFTTSSDYTMDKYGIAFKEQENVCYISLYVPTQTYLVLYRHDKTEDIENVPVNGEIVHTVEPDSAEKISRIEVELNLESETLSIFQKTLFGESYWAGHFYINGKAYVTGGREIMCVGLEMQSPATDRESVNEQDYKTALDKLQTWGTNIAKYKVVAAGYRLGCYFDKGSCACSGSKGNAFEKQYAEIVDPETDEVIESKYRRLEVCREKAFKDNSSGYFALANDGICYSHPNQTTEIGESGQSITIDGKTTVTQYGVAPASRCSGRSIHRNAANEMGLTTGGSHNVADVHSLNEAPGIRTYGGLEHNGNWVAENFITLESAQEGAASPDDGNGTSGMLHPDTCCIQVDMGGEPVDEFKKGYHVINRWIQFTMDVGERSRLDFCPNREYSEFNAGACFDGSNETACTNTPKRGYTPNKKLCITNLERIYVGDKNFKFKNRYFFGTLTSYLSSIQSLYHSKRMEFLTDMVSENATTIDARYDPNTQAGVLSDLADFREKLSSVTVGNYESTSNIGDQVLASTSIFHLVFRSLVNLKNILVSTCYILTMLYPEDSIQYNFCSTNGLIDNSSGVQNAVPLIDNMMPPNPNSTPIVREYFDAINAKLAISNPIPDTPDMKSLVTNYAMAANTISDAITMSLTSKVKGTDSIEELRTELTSKVSKFAESMNEVVHKINFLFSSCKCVPGIDSVYCTPC